jgi:hypothetical protein
MLFFTLPSKLMKTYHMNTDVLQNFDPQMQSQLIYLEGEGGENFLLPALIRRLVLLNVCQHKEWKKRANMVLQTHLS